MTTQTPNDIRSDDAAEALELLNEAREAYEEFAAKWSAVGESVRRLNDWQYQRVDAYPGWSGTRDVGAGVDMFGWMEEVEHFLDNGGRTEDEVADDQYGDDPVAYGRWPR